MRLIQPSGISYAAVLPSRPHYASCSSVCLSVCLSRTGLENIQAQENQDWCERYSVEGLPVSNFQLRTIKARGWPHNM